MKPQFKAFTFSLLLLFARPTPAHPSTVPTLERWDLDTILARASEQAPEFKALGKDIERAENLARQAGKWDNPEGSVSYGPMRQEGVPGTNLNVTLLQNIPIFGQKAIAEKVGEQDRITVEAESKRQLLALKHEVVRLAYRLAAVDEFSKHLIHRREKINLIVEFLKTRPFAAPAQAVEKDLVLNRLREIEDKLLQISSTRAAAWRALNVFLALESPIVPELGWTIDPKLPDREELFTLFQDKNLDLKRQLSLIEAAGLRAEQAGKRKFPDIWIGGNYSAQQADLPQYVYAGTLQLSFPIVDQGTYATQAALAERAAEIYRLEQKKRVLHAQFHQAWTVLQQNRKRLELFPISLITTLERQMTKAEQNWRKGLVQVIAFLELENQVHEQIFKIFDAQTTYIEALSELEFLAGIEFKAEKEK